MELQLLQNSFLLLLVVIIVLPDVLSLFSDCLASY